MPSPSRWLVLTVLRPPSGAEPFLVETLVELGGRAVVEDAQGLTSHFPDPADPGSFLAEARARLETAAGEALQLEWRWQPHEAWEKLWRRGLEPRRVTERILVTPSWVEPEEGAPVVIRVDPGVAFGTAEHATTRACLRLLDGVVREGDAQRCSRRTTSTCISPATCTLSGRPTICSPR